MKPQFALGLRELHGDQRALDFLRGVSEEGESLVVPALHSKELRGHEERGRVPRPEVQGELRGAERFLVAILGQ